MRPQRQYPETLETVSRCQSVLQKLNGGDCLHEVISAVQCGKLDKLWNGEIPFPKFTDSFPVDYFAYNLLRKFPFRGHDRKATAMATFVACEKQCKETNERLKMLNDVSNVTWDAIRHIREKIDRVLGRFDWNLAEPHFAHGPGATTRLLNSEGDVYFKFRGKPQTTMGNLPLSVASVGRIPLWFGEIHPLSIRDMFDVVPGCKITTVPKSAKTDRTIGIEPDMNIYVQKGIGTLMKHRLRRVGVDLRDQSLNQELARHALDRGLATIDLSSASDTVSEQLVKLLLPADWLSALEACRSPRYTLRENRVTKTYRFEKFSTMGNGYTFELESLIFWAITSFVVDETFSMDRTVGIYGDDIICPSFTVPRLLWWLDLFGFSTNKEKSYWHGPFRESCGKHFFFGSEVTPVYVDEQVVQPHRSAWFANSIVRWAGRIQWDPAFGDQLEVWQQALQWVASPFHRHIPDGVGDGGVVVPKHRYISEFAVRRVGRAREYQRGFSYLHQTESKKDLTSRDPEDVPYLLRYLKKVDGGKLTSCGRGPFCGGSCLICIDENSKVSREPSSIINVREWKRTLGWTSSWEAPVFGS